MKIHDYKGIVLFCLTQEYSSFNSSFALADSLKEYGYKVIYIIKERWQRYIGMQGFEYKVFNIIREHQVCHNLKDIKSVKETERKRRTFLRELETWLDKIKPDIAILHSSLMEISFPFLKLKIPCISYRADLASSFNINYPPVFSSIIPRSKPDIFTYFKNLLAWLICYQRIFRKNIKMKAALFLCYGISFYKYSKKRFVKKYNASYQWGEYNYHLKQYEYIVCPREFEFPNQNKSELRFYTGTNIHIPKYDNSFNFNELHKNKNIVYCSLGSHSEVCLKGIYRLSFYSAVINAIALRSDMQLVIQMDEKKMNQLNPLPKNVFAYQWLPQTELLSKTFIFITHGGMASVKEAVYCGVPMIVFPFYNDEYGNAARIVYHNLGLHRNIKRATKEIVNSSIDKICEDLSIRNSVQQMKKIFREQNDKSRYAKFIERFLGSG